MKTAKIIILIGFFTGLFSCNNDDENIGISNPDVEAYIELLKTNQYKSSKLPEFTSNDIPDLLEHINDKNVITKFPHNPIRNSCFMDD